METQYDLVIIGAGTAAMVAAMRVRAAGWRVAVTDFRPYGGTCALRGCDPKKMLISGTSAIDHVHRMHDKGVAGDVHIDWQKLMAFKRSFTDAVPAKNEQRYRDKGIDIFHGRAQFTGKNSLDVDGQALEAKYVLIASGAEPVKLNIPGEEYLIDNEGFLSLEALPKRIVVVGGGFIAAEFSHIAARTGTNVTVIEGGQRILQAFDADLVGWLMEKFQALGIDVRTRTSVEAIEKINNGYRVRASTDGAKVSVDADLVVHAAGRVPALASLNLRAAGVATSNGRLELNDYLQSVTNPAVYAAGDAAQKGPPLTPVSSHDGKVVAANILRGNHQKPDYRGIPSVAFTTPPIARAGLSEAEAHQQGIKFRVQSQRASAWFTARQAAEPLYGFKVLVDEQTDLVVGAHLVGPHVDEVINVFALAIRHGITTEELKSTMFAYPTGASDVGYML